MARAAQRQPRRAVLSRDRIVEAALALVDEHGLDALTLRGVAARLGVTPMPLYRHVQTRDELVDLVVAELLVRDVAGQELPTSWEPLLRSLTLRTRDALLRHPIILQAVQRRPLVGPGALHNLDHMLAVLTEEGLTIDEALAVWARLLMHTVGYVSIRQGREQTRRAEGRTEAEDVVRTTEMLQSLSPTEFTHVVAGSAAIARLINEEHFEDGVQQIIDSVRAELSRRSRHGGGSGRRRVNRQPT